MTIGEKVQEVLKGIKVIENKEYNLMTISKEMWDSDYQGEPTIPLSVIEKIKAGIRNEITSGGKWSGEYYEVTEEYAIKKFDDIIDKAVKECTHETRRISDCSHGN